MRCTRASLFALAPLALGTASACANLSGLNAYTDCPEPCDAATGVLESSTPGTDAGSSGADGFGAGNEGAVGAMLDSTVAQEVSTSDVSATDVETPPQDATVADSAPEAASVDARGPVDSGVPEAGPVDAAHETSGGGGDAEAGSGVGGGPACLGSDGGYYLCNSGQHCCVNSMTTASQCAETCVAPEYAVDCAGSTNTTQAIHQCGSQICCGTLVLGNGNPPNCSPTSLQSSCQPACIDGPPISCNSTSTVHLCWSTADCTSASLGNTECCKFGTSPVYWCVNTTIALEGTCM